MIDGVHAILYSKGAAKDRRFLKDTLGLKSVDAGDGWLIFGLPPAEIAMHPGEPGRAELYFMVRDIDAALAALRKRRVKIIQPVVDRGWGRLATIALPSGAPFALYEPHHPTAIRRRAVRPNP